MSLDIILYDKEPEYYTTEEDTTPVINLDDKPDGMLDRDYYKKIFSEVDYVMEGDIKNDATEFSRFSIGYFGFKRLREAIAKATNNFHYETNYTEENPFGDHRLFWEEDDELFIKFLLHSDSDGSLGSDTIKHLAKVINNLPSEVDDPNWEEFLDFVNESVKLEDPYWEFM